MDQTGHRVVLWRVVAWRITHQNFLYREPYSRLPPASRKPVTPRMFMNRLVPFRFTRSSEKDYPQCIESSASSASGWLCSPDQCADVHQCMRRSYSSARGAVTGGCHAIEAQVRAVPATAGSHAGLWPGSLGPVEERKLP